MESGVVVGVSRKGGVARCGKVTSIDIVEEGDHQEEDVEEVREQPLAGQHQHQAEDVEGKHGEFNGS